MLAKTSSNYIERKTTMISTRGGRRGLPLVKRARPVSVSAHGTLATIEGS